MSTITLARPSYVMNAEGQPEAVLIDIATWQLILERLQDIADNQILSEALADLNILASGNRPAGWKSWEEFEKELDAQEVAGELPD
ncbi:MAG: hypothetical protein Fur0044_37720 [Anaerolineae bacterium]